jgi:hypothetical protein
VPTDILPALTHQQGHVCPTRTPMHVSQALHMCDTPWWADTGTPRPQCLVQPQPLRALAGRLPVREQSWAHRTVLSAAALPTCLGRPRLGHAFGAAWHAHHQRPAGVHHTAIATMQKATRHNAKLAGTMPSWAAHAHPNMCTLQSNKLHVLCASVPELQRSTFMQQGCGLSACRRGSPLHTCRERSLTAWLGAATLLIPQCLTRLSWLVAMSA